MRKLALAAGFCLLSFPAMACYNVTIENATPAAVTAIWTASGCTAQHAGFDNVCADQALGFNKAATYRYSTTSTPIVYVYLSVDVNDQGQHPSRAYIYGNGGFTSGGGTATSPGCTYDTYSISYNDEDWWCDTDGKNGRQPPQGCDSLD